jgi:hypothetical protein
MALTARLQASPAAHIGHVLENPATGERITFEETAAESAGERPRFQLAVVGQEFAPEGHATRRPGAAQRRLRVASRCQA